METPNHVQAAKHIPHGHRTSPSPYPVSTRAYRKKDYEYLSTFACMTESHALLRVTRSDTELLRARSDCDSSDLSMTASTVGYTTSLSSASSTSVSQTYGKELITSMDSEGHHQHQHMFLSTQPSRDSPMDCADTTVKEAKHEKVDDKVGDMSHADVKNGDLDVAGDCSGPVQEGSTQVKAPKRIQSKSKSRPHNTPVVLPKFGSWDTKNPSSGESYTLIFRRLKDEKESGGLPVCASPTHSNEEEAVESLSQESKAKEVLHANTQVQKNSSRQKGNGLSQREKVYIPKHTTRWNFCCKALVVDD